MYIIFLYRRCKWYPLIQNMFSRSVKKFVRYTQSVTSRFTEGKYIQAIQNVVRRKGVSEWSDGSPSIVSDKAGIEEA